MGKPKGQDEAMAASKMAAETAKQNQQLQQQIYSQIQPFASALMALGISPDTFMQSPLGQSMIGQMRQGVSQNYVSARNNLQEGLGNAGLTGSGVGVGPMANLYSQEALANANIMQQLPQMGLNLGLTGANMLTGQQQVLNPLGWSGQAIQGYENVPQGGFWSNFTKSLGGSLGASLGSFKTQAGPFTWGQQ